ncbi:MAG: hypothetical protein AAGI63_16060, partial [Planctomycetota bacterium]
MDRRNFSVLALVCLAVLLTSSRRTLAVETAPIQPGIATLGPSIEPHSSIQPGTIPYQDYAFQAAADSQPIRLLQPFSKCYASLDFVMLSRSADDLSVSFDLGGGNSAEVNLSHGLNPGVRATFGVRTGPTGHFQVSYLGINEWTADNRTADVLFGGGPTTLSSVDEYRASLNDLQFNLVAMDPYANFDLLFGFRVIDQRDEAESIVSTDDQLGNPNSITTERAFAKAANTLLGLQAGANYGYVFGPLTFQGGAKFGVFYNDTSQSGTIFSNAIVVDGTPEPTFSTDGGDVSFMGDFGGSLSYLVTSRASIRIGYQGLVFSDLLQSTDRRGAPSGPSGLTYHGVYAGMEIL